MNKSVNEVCSGYADDENQYFLTHNDHYSLDQQTRRALVDFLQGLLQLNPLNRWTPMQARYHPFITGEPFTEPYVPEVHMKAAMKLHQQQQQQQQSSTEANEISGSQASSSSASGGGSHHADNHVHALEAAAMAATSKRSRAQSMGVPQAPSPIQELTTRQHRHRRSQGNLIGVLPPEAPGAGGTSDSSSVEKHTVFANGDPQQQTASVERKVKIAAQVKVRYGSRDSLCMPDQVHRGNKGDGRDDALLQQQHQRPAGRLSHAGEAAGGLLMMRQQDKASSSQGVAAAIKRRAIL